jgi:hypothetical protein
MSSIKKRDYFEIS